MSNPVAINDAQRIANEVRTQAIADLKEVIRDNATLNEDNYLFEVAMDVLSTTDTTPPLSGTISDANATIQVILDGAVYTATNNGDGTWDIADATVSTLALGTYDVKIVAYYPVDETIGVKVAKKILTITA